MIHYLHQQKNKVSTAYLAPNPDYSPASSAEIESVQNAYSLSNPYFLYVGDINYNKNLPALLETFASIHSDHLLVLVSSAIKRENPAAGYLWSLIDRLHLEPRLRILNQVPNSDLSVMRGLYSGAFWYIQPSLYEGFGLPVLEAQACACPVLSSIGGSLGEVTAQSAVSFDPSYAHALSDAIARIVDMSESQRQSIIVQGLNNAHRFSWEKTVVSMKKVYQLCAG